MAVVLEEKTKRPFKLAQLGFLGRGKSRHRPRNDSSLFGGDYPFIQTGEVKAANLYVSEYTETYNDKGLAQSKLWQPGTLLITIAANIAETAILKIPACFPDSMVGFIPDSEKADVKYVKYYIDYIKLQMQSVSRGTTQDNLSLDKIDTFDFLIPSVEKQQKIASILSAYDDLIENNLRRIKLLEEMAQSLYREWFVHFRYPGHEHVPLVDSGHPNFGPIPQGWAVKKLGDIIELAYGKALTAETRVVGDYPVYGSSGVVGTHNQFLTEAPGIIVGRKGNVGSIFWTDKPFYPIDTVYYVKTDFSLLYAFYNLNQQNFISSDAAVPGLNREYAYSLPFLKPSNEIIKTFEEFITPVFQQLQVLRTKNNNLRQTRDLLLPRLISGQLDVSNLEVV